MDYNALVVNLLAEKQQEVLELRAEVSRRASVHDDNAKLQRKIDGLTEELDKARSDNAAKHNWRDDAVNC